MSKVMYADSIFLLNFTHLLAYYRQIIFIVHGQWFVVFNHL